MASARNERHSSRVRWARLLGAFAALLLVAVVVTGRLVSRRVLFPVGDVRKAALPHDFEQWTMRAEDGAPVHALALLSPGDRRVVVHFHNNRETMADPAWMARELRRRGAGVVLAEFRGYGLSSGLEPTEEGLYEDAEAVLARVREAGFGPDRVVLWGTSLGTGVAAEMARRGRGAALVLVTPYTSIPDVVSAFAPLVPASLLVPDRFDTLDKAADIRVPTLVVHGDADEIIPFAMGRQVAARIPNASLARIGGGHHGDLFLREGPALLDWIARLAVDG